MKKINLTDNKKLKFFVTTNGCPENRIDAKTLINSLEKKGLQYTSNFKESDLIFLNACGLHIKKQQESLDAYKVLEDKKNENTKLIIYGCILKILPSTCNLNKEAVVIGSDEIAKLSSLCDINIEQPQDYANELVSSFKDKNLERLKLKRLFKNNHQDFEIEDSSRKGIRKIINLSIKFILSIVIIIEKKIYRLMSNFSKVNSFRKNSFCIKISTGCLNNCAFCGVRKSRGHLKSRNISQIMNEFNKGIEKGYTEFSILGTDVGAYGKDIDTNLVILLKKMIKNSSKDTTIRLRNIQPKYLIEYRDDFLEILKSKKIPYLESAFEAGSNAILKKMRRGYTIENYIETIALIKKEIPSLDIRSQIIVGFPGETKSDFNKTKSVLRKLTFNSIEIYPFQPIDGTDAAKMDGQISDIKKLLRVLNLYYTLIKKGILNKN